MKYRIHSVLVLDVEVEAEDQIVEYLHGSRLRYDRTGCDPLPPCTKETIVEDYTTNDAIHSEATECST